MKLFLFCIIGTFFGSAELNSKSLCMSKIYSQLNKCVIIKLLNKRDADPGTDRAGYFSSAAHFGFCRNGIDSVLLRKWN